jgi:hypothetical protein
VPQGWMKHSDRLTRKAHGSAKLLSVLASDRASFHVIRRVLKDRLSYLDAPSLADLHASVVRLEKEERPGILIEAGCAQGGSALVMSASKRASRELRVYDVFGMIPPPSARDGPDAHARYDIIAAGESSGIRGDTYYGYRDDLFDRVYANFTRFGYPPRENNIHLVRGLFQDTLVVSEPVALAHIDSDWYDSVFTCLERIEPMVVQGGVLIIDDYDTWTGCRAAVDDYFADNRDDFEFTAKRRLHIRRK